MPTMYQRVVPVQEPFDLGPWQDYAQWAFNAQVTRSYSAESMLRELASVVQDAALGVFGVDLFIAGQASAPAGTGPWIWMTNYASQSPLLIHNTPLPRHQRPLVQVLVRARYDEQRTPQSAAGAAEQRVRDVYAALSTIVNESLTALP